MKKTTLKRNKHTNFKQITLNNTNLTNKTPNNINKQLKHTLTFRN